MQHFGAWMLAGKFCRGWVISTICSEIPATWVLLRCGVGWPAILRVSIWRRFRAEILHPLQSFVLSSFIWRLFSLICLSKWYYYLNMDHAPFFFCSLLDNHFTKFVIIPLALCVLLSTPPPSLPLPRPRNTHTKPFFSFSLKGASFFKCRT